MALNLKDPASRAAWVYGQPMAPCPKCCSYNMKPQMPIKIELAGNETAPGENREMHRARLKEDRRAAARQKVLR